MENRDLVRGEMGTLESGRSGLEDGGLQNEDSGLYTGDGSVDIKGKPVLKKNTGNWKACFFILGTETSERMAYYGIAANLVTYLTRKLHQGNVSAARNMTIWQGTCYLVPLIGAVLADAYWGRYWTIAVSSTIYMIGMCVLALSASVPGLRPAECFDSVCPSSSFAEYAVFLLGLYLVALGTGGIKPCVSPFGADQFDDTDSKEKVKKATFFNWFYFTICSGILVSSTFLVWIQDNVGWGIGFATPALCMVLAIVVFLSGTLHYRFQKPKGSPITRICQVLVAACRKWNLDVPKDRSLLYETQDKSYAVERSSSSNHSDTLNKLLLSFLYTGLVIWLPFYAGKLGNAFRICFPKPLFGSVGFLKFLDKAAVISNVELRNGNFSDPWRLCTVTQVEELKTLVHLLPIWVTGISVAAVYAQITTMFVEQGMMMDATIGSFTIPVASFSSLDIICSLVFVPVYDRVVLPIARRLTGNEKGFSELQRIGIGLFFSILCMSAAAILERNRLQLAKKLDLVDKKVAVPLSIFWQTAQYFLVGITETLTYIAQMEFFYEESPNGMKSLCSALLLLSLSLGYYLSSFILTIVTYFTRKAGKGGWVTDNLNEGHLDYYFWLLACLSFLNLFVFIVCAKMFKPKNGS